MHSVLTNLFADRFYVKFKHQLAISYDSKTIYYLRFLLHLFTKFFLFLALKRREGLPLLALRELPANHFNKMLKSFLSWLVTSSIFVSMDYGFCYQKSGRRCIDTLCSPPKYFWLEAICSICLLRLSFSVRCLWMKF